MKVVQFKYIKTEHWAHDAIGSYSPAQRRKTIEVIEKMYRPVYYFLFFQGGGLKQAFNVVYKCTTL